MLNSGHIRIYHISHNPLKVVENDATSVCNVPDIRKGVAVCEGSQVSPAYKSSMMINSGVPRGVWGFTPHPEIPKISVESSIA